MLQIQKKWNTNKSEIFSCYSYIVLNYLKLLKYLKWTISDFFFCFEKSKLPDAQMRQEQQKAKFSVLRIKLEKFVKLLIYIFISIPLRSSFHFIPSLPLPSLPIPSHAIPTPVFSGLVVFSLLSTCITGEENCPLKDERCRLIPTYSLPILILIALASQGFYMGIHTSC